MIRPATIFDTESIIAMLEQYKHQSPLEFHKNTNDTKARLILAQILAGRGCAFVNEENGELNGMIIAMINPNMWDDHVLSMNELAYWVNPEARHSTIGYRLLKQYQEYCEEIKALGKIQYFTISKMSTSPDLNYNRFGFSKLEEMWRA